MAIPSATVSAYAPWGNAQLSFRVPTGTTTTDPATGNAIQSTETVEYLATLTLETPNWTGKPGADETVYPCRGRLLSPSTLDNRIVNGSQAEATINGARGRFELTFDLTMVAANRVDLRQLIQGTFRVTGGM